MEVICLDLEGVLVPEIWIEVAKKTGIKDLRLTTRDIPDYDVLMRRRIQILKRENVKLRDIQRVISGMSPLPGAKSFLDRIRQTHQVIILSDTFIEFAMPLMKKLGAPTIFCNSLKVDKSGFITGHVMRQRDGKRKVVNALHSVGFTVAASGDSYNDVTMLQTAEKGIFFNPPSHFAKKYPRLKAVTDYKALYKFLIHA